MKTVLRQVVGIDVAQDELVTTSQPQGVIKKFRWGGMRCAERWLSSVAEMSLSDCHAEMA